MTHRSQTVFILNSIALVFALAIACAIPFTLTAQQTASVSGTIQDALGKAISEANVAVAVASHEPTATTKTDEDGHYKIEGIIPGTYNVTISRSGFRTQKILKVVISSGEARTINATLQVGQPIVDDEYPAASGQSQDPAAPHTVLFPIVSSCVTNPDFAPQCAFVDATAGYAILKDRRGESQLLLVATRRRWGMEDPNIEKRDEPNYFEEAWDARRCVATPNGSPAHDSEIALAINSKFGRSDGQLHIHIDLLKPGIADELGQRSAHLRSLHPGATERDRAVFTFSGHPYSIAHYETLHGHNLFADLQKHLAPGDEMANHTIVVIEDPAGGFFVLTDRAHGLDRASGEELQIDHHNLDPQRFLQLSNQAKSCLASPPH